MGEIADGLINGDFDSESGEYLGEGYGFPRSTNWDRENKARNKAYWKSLPKEQQEVMKIYQSIIKHSMAQVRMRHISNFLHKELGMIQMPKSIEQYKLVYNNIDKFKEYLKTLII